jgi:hypothetical protein
MRRIIGIILILLGLNVSAQFDTSLYDSIEEARIMNEFYYKTKFQVRLAHARTLLTKEIDIKINTFRVGFQFKQHYKVGLQGFVSKTYQTESVDVPEVEYYNTAVVGYGAYFEYVFIENYRFYLGAPFSISQGWVRGEAINNNGKRASEYDWMTNKFGIISVGGTGGYSINYWLSVSAGLGYRFSFSNDRAENKLLTTPFYSFGIRVQFGHFITTVFKHQEVNKMKAIYFRDKDTWRGRKFKAKHPTL